MNVKRIDELIPWRVTDISLRPYKEMWSFNPSIHFDGRVWRCVVRCSDYAMPAGVTIRSRKAKHGQSKTKNAMIIFDPTSWRPTEIYKMRERDELPRAASGSVGYEDVRIFRSDKYGLQGIAAALHLRRVDRGAQVAEQVLLGFDDEYNIVDARPIRGRNWSSYPQKNWVPFDHCVEPRFLYSIEKGALFSEQGDLRGSESVRPSARPPLDRGPGPRAIERARKRALETEEDRAREHVREAHRRVPRIDAPCLDHAGLRGGSQLVRIDDASWLAIGHAMKLVDNLKYYWHVWYLVDAQGKLTAASCPMKLVDNGIEFAAGLALDGERVVVSFGVDDMQCRIGETTLSAVIETLRPVGEL